MPFANRKLLAMVLLVIREACEDDSEFIIEKDLEKLCSTLGPVMT